MKSHAKKRQSNHAKIGKLGKKIFKNLFKASITLDLPVDRVTLLSDAPIGCSDNKRYAFKLSYASLNAKFAVDIRCAIRETFLLGILR